MDMARIDKGKMEICHHYKGRVPNGATVTGKCRAGARYVMITIPAGYLTLCDVGIFSLSDSEGKIGDILDGIYFIAKD